MAHRSNSQSGPESGGVGVRPAENGARLIALLGPTNTGKTHFAMERMLGHATGMIGFPLRLLARENYDRVVAAKGAQAVALVTGEEKIIPRRPRYWVCTVESMPLDRPVECLAVDEIQLAADPERGHIFTDRLLRARGLSETIFLGSDTAWNLVRRLAPGIERIQRPRLSTLTYAGAKKLTRLPPRSAVVAFSATEVYETAELIRRQRGGAAVVLGALSPRTRNAQVALYQAGEVDYLVATDAIGMGLNMDVDHVAFARITKFDGQRRRRLTAQEIGQIAGRAGRNMAHGTFGVTGAVGELDPELVESVENHRFDPLTLLMWRNADLDFRSGGALLASLDAPPPYGCLRRVREADDHHALATLLRESDAAKKAKGRAAVRLLWDVCQIPDFRKVMSDQHAHLLSQIYGHLSGPGRLPAEWVDGQVSRLDKTEGDIDTLVSRIAHVRTWTYVTHRPEWIADPLDWQERTRALEDRLSDALHERLTQRFIDRRAAGLVRSLASGDALLAGVRADGEVLVEGHPVGRLEGFRFVADATALGGDAKPVLTAARRALRSEIARRVALLEQADERDFALISMGEIAWSAAPVARLVAGAHPLKPRVVALDSDLLLSGEAERVRKAASAWLDGELARVFPMAAALQNAALTGAARGLAFQLAEALAPLERHGLDPLLADVTRADAARLRRMGVVAGSAWVFLRELTKPRAVALRAALWQAEHGVWTMKLPPVGRVSISCEPETDHAYWRAIGYPVVGPRAIRVDMLDRLVQRLERATVEGVMRFDPTIAPALGCGRDEVEGVLAALGWVREEGEAGPVYRRRRARAAIPRPGRRRERGDASPFSVLKQLAVAE